MKRLRVAITGLTSCSGCQLALLNCEAELPQLLELVDFRFFPMACSPATLESDYDAALVEGCLSMPHEQELLLSLRKRSRYLVAVGTCAAWGGVAALKNDQDREQLRQQVYGTDSTAALETFSPLPLNAVVQVDATVTGCPPEKEELIGLLTGLLKGSLPTLISYPVCTECRMKETLCLLTERSALCLGPLTLGGCGALCPALGVPCEGCRGPVPEANLAEAMEIYLQKGYAQEAACERLRRFCPGWRA